MKSKTYRSKSSPIVITGIIFLLFVAALIVGFYYFQYLMGYWVLVALYVLSVIFGIIIVNLKANSAYKIGWLFFMIAIPPIAIIFFLLFANKKFTKKEYKRIKPIINASKMAMNSRLGHDDINILDKEADLDAINIATYIRRYSYTGIYDGTKTTYYSWGESGFPVMLDRLRKAKHYIYLEYFIISEGFMWDSIVEILKQKAKEGLDIRVIYDDLGSAKHLPKKYYKELRSYDIKAYAFNRIKPIFEIRMNNRDHRKILVIDGYIGFTGGINIADEYINRIERFGKWKDNVIMLEGEAVFGLTSLFLSNWIMLDDSTESINYLEYLPRRHQQEYIYEIKNDGFVQPYGSLPFTYETIGENVYIDIINKAKKYIYITTPYLILDDILLSALCQAAKNGVDVKIITPHIPDKKIVFQLTRSYYKPLIEAGVDVYEYEKGFIHEKTILADGIMGTCGTINFDYRSLFLHMENGIFLYKCSALKDMERDFTSLIAESIPFSYEMVHNVSIFRKMLWAILRIVAPLV